MKKLFLLPGIIIYLMLMNACAGDHNHDADDTTHVHEDGTVHANTTAEPIAVQPVEDEADHAHETGSLPEHTAITLKKRDFSFVIKAGGTILPDAKDVISVTAKTSGIVRLTDHYLFPGMKVKKGAPLFIISGDALANDNSEISLKEAKSDFDLAKANFERAERLIVNNLVTMGDFLEAKSNFEKAQVRYNNLMAGHSAGGNTVTSPADGYVNQVFISEGTKVSAGETILNVIIEHNLVLQADVSPQHIAQLGEVQQANFRLTYNDRVYSTENMNGIKISHARTTIGGSYYIPVFFRIDFNSEILPGTFAEVYLKGAPRKDCIVIPNTSILEEFGKFYVFVEDEGHGFVKRYIQKGMTDGSETEVLSGLAENETIVATGAFAIKMSQMGTSTPDAHQH